MAKMTKKKWLQKAGWEGGVVMAIIGYGLSEKDLDKNKDPEFYAQVKRVRKGLRGLESDIEDLDDQIDNQG